jgi:hypothetical protein
METIKHNIPKKSINLYHVTDVHLGAENFREKEFKEFIEVIKKDPDGYWIGGGDFIEGITLSDPRFSPGELQSKYNLKDLNDLPRKQMKAFYKLIKPIQDKCLGLVIGNHEEKYIKYNHFDVYDYLADDLMGQPELKLGKNGYILLVIGNTSKRLVKIFITHGEGLSCSPDDGTVMNSFVKLTQDKIADLYFAGHTHRLTESTKMFMDVDKTGKTIDTFRSFIIGGAWLKKYHTGTSGYFESKRGFETMPGYIKTSLSVGGEFHKLKVNPVKVYL